MKSFATSWIDDRMPYQVSDAKIGASDFNAIRLGILRLGSPLSFNLDVIKGLRCVLDDHAWIFMDRFVNDMPLLAWMNFESRGALNETIPCELRLYHFKAGLLVDMALDALQDAIDEQLRESKQSEMATVSRL